MEALIARLRRDPGLALVVLAVLAAIALYASTLGRGLVNFDDYVLVRDNWVVRDPSWSSISTILFDLDSPRRYVLSPEYLPVRDLSIMFDFAVWGDRFEGFHLTNLVVYVTAICVWFSALTALGIDRRIAGLAIFLYAIHPSHAESVAWITERKGLLALLFAGICVATYARYRRGDARRWLAVAAVAAVLAVWSKATGAFAVGALVGLELVVPQARASRRRSLVGLAVIGVLAAAAFVPVLQLASDASVIGTAVNAPASRLAMTLGVHGFYLRMMAMTSTNAVSYPLSSVGPSALEIVVGAIGLALLLAVAIIPARGRWAPPGEVRAGAVIWLFGWLPASHLIFPLQLVLVADRYLLIPSLGIALIVAAGITRIRRPSIRRALIVVLGVAAALRTLDAQSAWHDSKALWQRAVASNPRDASAWTMYVESATSEPEALALAEKALAVTSSPRLLHRQALLLLRHDRPRAIGLMRAAAEAGETLAMSNLALLLLEDRDIPNALVWARRGAARNNAHAHRTHGKVALAAGEATEALGAFQAALALEPTCANRINLALALIALQRGREAAPWLDACVADPALGAKARNLRERALAPH